MNACSDLLVLMIQSYQCSWNGPCLELLNDPPDGFNLRQSPMRLTAQRPSFAPFISCFQNDISLASEDQQAWQETEELSVLEPEDGEHAKVTTSRRTGPPRILLWPWCRLCSLSVRVKWTSGYLWPVLGFACLWRSLAGTCRHGLEPQAGPHCSNVD